MINGDCLVGLCAIKVALHSIEFVVCTTVVNVFVGNQSATHRQKERVTSSTKRRDENRIGDQGQTWQSPTPTGNESELFSVMRTKLLQRLYKL